MTTQTRAEKLSSLSQSLVTGISILCIPPSLSAAGFSLLMSTKGSSIDLDANPMVMLLIILISALGAYSGRKGNQPALNYINALIGSMYTGQLYVAGFMSLLNTTGLGSLEGVNLLAAPAIFIVPFTFALLAGFRPIKGRWKRSSYTPLTLAQLHQPVNGDYKNKETMRKPIITSDTDDLMKGIYSGDSKSNHLTGKILIQKITRSS